MAWTGISTQGHARDLAVLVAGPRAVTADGRVMNADYFLRVPPGTSSENLAGVGTSKSSRRCLACVHFMLFAKLTNFMFR